MLFTWTGMKGEGPTNLSGILLGAAKAAEAAGPLICICSPFLFGF